VAPRWQGRICARLHFIAIVVQPNVPAGPL